MGNTVKRCQVGPRFSEAARQWWIELRRRGETIADATRALRAPAGAVSRWIYGDRLPSIEWMAEIAKGYPSVSLALWARRPVRSFTLPAARGLAA